MPAPAWLQEALVVVGRTGVKALRQGMREGAANAIDSVLEDVQVFTEEINRRVQAGRSSLRDVPKTRSAPKARKPQRKKTEPEVVVIDAEIIEEEKE